MGLSVIMPMRNECQGLCASIRSVIALLREGDELIVVDGESSDGSLGLAQSLERDYAQLRVLVSEPGRARQMNLGALSAKNPMLLFLHADTVLSPQAWAQLVSQLQDWDGQSPTWGRFDVQIVGHSLMLPVVAALMNWRSRLSQIATGDQAIFVSRQLFMQVGAFPEQPLMEDVEFCKRLKPLSGLKFTALRGPVLTSGRRWDEVGAWRTIFLMWRFRYLYWRGVPAEALANHYREVRERGEARALSRGKQS